MAISLADHVYKNRALFTINKANLPNEGDEPKTFWYNYDTEDIVKGYIRFYPMKDMWAYEFGIQCYKPNEVTIIGAAGITISYDEFKSPITIFTTTDVIFQETTCLALSCKCGDTLVYETFVSKDRVYRYLKDYTIEESKPPVCPNCGKPHDPNGDCDNENCEENPNIKPPENPNDNPPVILGYASNEIWDIEGYAGYNTSVFFRAYDDYGIYRFSYCEIDEHETEGLQIIRDFKPEKIGDIAYKFNIFKELEGNYKYQIYVYDTAKQKAESNIFNVTIKPAITPPVNPPTPPNVADSEHIILYDKKANDFTNNGIGVLDNDVIDCIVDKEENGVYELTLKYLITGKFTENLLDTENIIKCKSDISNNIAQLFRIYDSEYIMQDNVIVIKAQHISYDLKNAFVENVNLIDVTCKQATQSLISQAIGNDRFVVNSNIETRSNFSQQRVNVLESIVGIEKSIFDVYGGNGLVIERDNFHYNINKKTDNDKGVVIAYSKNLLGFKRSVNSDGVITGIYPFAHLRNGAILRLKEKVIYSNNKDYFATPIIKAIDFTKETVVNEETLRSEAQKYFDNGCDMLRLNYEVNFVSLYSNNPLLKDKFKSLEEIILGDTVTIQDSKIGIKVKARVIRTSYNVLKKRYEKIELGNFSNEYRITKKSEQDNLEKIVRGIIN